MDSNINFIFNFIFNYFKKIKFNNLYFFTLIYFLSSSVASIVLLLPVIYLIFKSEYKIKFTVIFLYNYKFFFYFSQLGFGQNRCCK